MSNNITWTSGGTEGILGKSTIVLPPKTLNQSSTSLSLTGKGVFNYGEYQQENFLRILESFASANIPANPTIGQIWFNTTESTLYVCADSQTVPATMQQYHINGRYVWLKAGSSTAIGDISVGLGYIPAPPVAIASDSQTAMSVAITGGGTQTTLHINKSDGTHDGYLAAADWSRFDTVQSKFPTTSTGTIMVTDGDTMTGPLILAGDPTNSNGAATKNYVDNHSVSSIIAGSNITIDHSQGNVTISGMPGTVTSVTVGGTAGRITGSGTITSSGSIALDLATSGVSAGYYGMANVNVDAYGRITSAVPGTLTVQGTGALSGGGTIGSGGTATLDMAVIHGGGYFTNASVQLDGYGRVIGASSGTNTATAPNNSGGIGSWVVLGSGPSGDGVPAQLPPGGTWAYFVMNIVDDGNVTDIESLAGVAAGGTLLVGSAVFHSGQGFAWRIA
jgi:hypothetical protein